MNFKKIINNRTVKDKTFIISQGKTYSYREISVLLQELSKIIFNSNSIKEKNDFSSMYIVKGDGEIAHVVFLLFCLVNQITFIPYNRTLTRNPRLKNELGSIKTIECKENAIFDFKQSAIFDVFRVNRVVNEIDNLNRVDQNSIGEVLACLFPTSGTTGAPKLIAVSNSQLYRGAVFVSQALDLNSKDRIAGLLSLDFDYGINQLLSALHVGATYITCNLSNPKVDYLSVLQREKVSVVPLMPFLIERFFSGMNLNIRTVRLVTTSGGAITQKHRSAIKSIFSNAKFIPMYGLSEGFRATISNEFIDENFPESVGIPIGDTVISIRDDNGNVLDKGEVGEIWQSGGCLSWGYWKDPEANFEKFIYDKETPNRLWLKSGDLGYLNDFGCLVIVGRKTFQVKKFGVRISIDEVENALAKLFSNLTIVVIPVQRTTTESDFDVVYENMNDLEKEIFFKIRSNLPPEMWPRKIHRIESIPLNVYGGKPDRFALGQIFNKGI